MSVRLEASDRSCASPMPTLPACALAERKVRPGFLKQYDWTFTALAKHTSNGHIHGTIDSSVLRSRAGLKAVSQSLVVLLAATIVQAVVFVATESVALLADFDPQRR